MTPRRLLATVAVPLCLGLAACGEEAPTQQEFATQANEICATLSRELDAVRAGNPQSNAQRAEAVQRTSRLLDDTARRLRELELPEGAAGDRAQRFVETLGNVAQRQSPLFGELASAAREGNREAAQQALQRLQGIDTTPVGETARAAGATKCADTSS